MRLLSRPFAALCLLLTAGCSGIPGAGIGTLSTEPPVNTAGYNLSWGDGRRTVALYGLVDFTYTPILDEDAPADTVRDFSISHTGEVRVRRVQPQLQKELYELSKDESEAWKSVLGSITFDYALCPRGLPGAKQPYYTWVYLGGQYAGRAMCPSDPPGLTMLLAPETLNQVNVVLNRISTRLLGKPLITDSASP